MANNIHTHRKELILNMILQLGPISRTELIALTDYRPASVGAIVGELLEDQLVIETGYHSAGHGRKRAMLEINKAYLCAMGISFIENHVHFTIAQPDGKILHQSTLELSPDSPREAATEQIAHHAENVLNKFSENYVVGIGICNPLHDPHRYQPSTSLSTNYHHFNDWIDLGLKPRLEQLSVPQVKAFSGVTLPVLAEKRFGVAKDVDNFIWVELSNGLGISICCNGIPVAGANGVAGEIGHTVIAYGNDQKLCYCGKPGCVESIAAYPVLLSDIRSALKNGIFSVLSTFKDDPEQITIQDIAQALNEHDPMCMHYVKQAAKAIGVAIANAVNLLNPECIVLYGFMLNLGSWFLNQLEASIRENVLSVTGSFDIRISNTLESIMPLGAVAELFSDFLNSNNYRWIQHLPPLEQEGE